MSKNHSTPIPERIKELRESRGITQAKLGIEIGIADPHSASTRINQYERGVHVPNYKFLQKLAAYFEVPVFYFYVDEDYINDIQELLKFE